MNAAIATPALEVINGQITTTSLQIAEHFDKRHRDVLRAVTRLECSPEFTERNFAPSDYTDSTGRKLPCYRITRDGFVFLAMGFTGKDAARWKEAYIDAFNQMEAALLQQSQPASLTLAQQQQLKAAVQRKCQSDGAAYQSCYRDLYAAFGVPRYQDIAAADFDAALAFINRWQAQPKAPALDLTGGPDMQAAHEAACQYIDAVRSGQQTRWDLPPEVLQGLVLDALMSQRFIVSFGYRQGMSINPIARDAYILPASQWAKAIESGDAHLPPEELARLANVCTQRMARALQRRLPPSQPPALA
ncbi:hypothetical protein EII18_02910 [Comamonadaceae bacterium OH3737_COT-264]|nr:hypothetical protein EII18_02910 [Comamonadaceae bacterium OH3737_COT-264]